jgi:serine/threonine-protein kinase mTOR
LVQRLEKKLPIPSYSEWRAAQGEDRDRQALEGRQLIDSSLDKGKEVFNESNLRKAWDARNKSTKDDWINWIRKLSVALLREVGLHANTLSCCGLSDSLVVRNRTST